MRILSAERLRFPGAGSSAQGKPGPKARPRGVVDGQEVEIPVLGSIGMRDGGRQEMKHAASCTDVQATSAVKSQMLLNSNTSRDEE